MVKVIWHDLLVAVAKKAESIRYTRCCRLGVKHGGSKFSGLESGSHLARQGSMLHSWSFGFGLMFSG